MGDERIVQANGVDICMETFGVSDDPAILLIMGLAASMDYWEDDFCQRLAAGLRLVIRYDHRDTGRSVSFEPGAPPYTGSDLVADAVGLLDALKVTRAHVVGVSAGGGIGQELAIRHPDRVASLTLISTSPAIGTYDLPPSSDAVRRAFAEPLPDPDWSDREAVVAYLVNSERPFLGTVHADEQTKRRTAERTFDRTTNIESSQKNHWILDAGEPVEGSLHDISAPTLVLHGTEDPMFPYPHGEALADAIGDTRLVPLEGVGHEVPPRPVWDVVVPAILEHTAPPGGE